MPLPPSVVAFDMNETVVSLEPLGERLVDEGLPDGTLELWFARVLRDGFALAATGAPASFLDLAREHLGTLLGAHEGCPGASGAQAPCHPRDPEAVGNVLATLQELSPYPDVEPAFDRLRDAGVRIVTLTNGDRNTSKDWLARAGLDDRVEAYLDVSLAGGLWKPRAEPYLAAADACGVAPGEMALVAVHSWDVHGAQQAGLVGAYCRRLEGHHVGVYPPPDIEGDTLVDVVDALLAA